MNEAMRLKARIRNIAAAHHISAQAVLQNYMMERLLERISLSTYKDKFVLKGGILVAALVGLHSRTTMDMDATMMNFPLTEENIRKVFIEICAMSLDDGITFLLNHIKLIREDDEYGGYRISLTAHYQSIRTPLKVDLTVGDVITPGAMMLSLQSNFDDQIIEIYAYNIETLLAEKIETILRRSVLNTRPRDYYDVYIIVKTLNERFDNQVLREAVQATASKRMSTAAIEDHVAILKRIHNDAIMRQRWESYSNTYPYANGIEFDEVIEVLNQVCNKLEED